MKKPNKQKIDTNELMKDTDKLLNFINSLEKINLETVNIKELEKEITSLESNLKEKYKNVLPKNYKDDLDTEE